MERVGAGLVVSSIMLSLHPGSGNAWSHNVYDRLTRASVHDFVLLRDFVTVNTWRDGICCRSSSEEIHCSNVTVFHLMILFNFFIYLCEIDLFCDSEFTWFDI